MPRPSDHPWSMVQSQPLHAHKPTWRGMKPACAHHCAPLSSLLKKTSLQLHHEICIFKYLRFGLAHKLNIWTWPHHGPCASQRAKSENPSSAAVSSDAACRPLQQILGSLADRPLLQQECKVWDTVSSPVSAAPQINFWSLLRLDLVRLRSKGSQFCCYFCVLKPSMGSSLGRRKCVNSKPSFHGSFGTSPLQKSYNKRTESKGQQ